MVDSSTATRPQSRPQTEEMMEIDGGEARLHRRGALGHGGTLQVAVSRPRGTRDSVRGAFPEARGGPNTSVYRSISPQRKGARYLRLVAAIVVLLGAVVALSSSSLTVKRSNSLDSPGASSGGSTVPPVSVFKGWHLNSTLVADQPPLSSYPSPNDSTVLFLHVYKCAGTSLREVFTGWAIAEGYYGSVVSDCPRIDLRPDEKLRISLNKPLKRRGDLCLTKDYKFRDPEIQKAYLPTQKAFAGHFVWGFQKYVKQPHLMVTTLRNPLELMVSGQQQMHRNETKTLGSSISWINMIMKKRLKKIEENGLGDIGFIWRLVDEDVTGPHSGTLTPEEMQKFGLNAAENMASIWLVGVVEQYDGFLTVLQRMLDPGNRHPEIWTTAHIRRKNSSPVGSEDILQGLDPKLKSEFNATLQLQWEVYDVALNLWDRRCREVVEDDEYQELCLVPQAPATRASLSEEPYIRGA